jgi:regulator of cell morphogenesis and NO signaling
MDATTPAAFVPSQAGPALAQRAVADIAATLPGATAIFRRHKIDFCCGGQASLTEAAAGRGVALEPLLAELVALQPEDMAVPQDTDELTRLIETRYHTAHRRELPELVRLARRVEAVHGDKPGVPHGLADLLERMEAELGAHMLKEEQVLFPMMRRGGHPMIGHPIAVMRAEHDDHGEQLRALEALTDGGKPPAGACNTWRALFAGTRKLADDLAEHMHLENNVLFPRFGA